MKKLKEMMTAADKVKRFKTLLLSPHVLTEDEMGALWSIARYPGMIMFRTDERSASGQDPIIWPRGDYDFITGVVQISRHVIGTLERRGILKAHHKDEVTTQGSISYITWNIVWKKMKAFEQTKELMVQVALGSI
ncbi:hypothetical protein LCGC14_1736960 [marine sediment metagenome]|uniref:Uncharacterized protein n=1 Tax=marine sediment metagenome TaxID=412755 RepID=A0A0F9HVG7_9ZZZZ